MAYQPVSALQRGLLLLELVNTYGPEGLSQLKRRSGLPKATVLRLLETLRDGGYISFDEDRQTYQVAMRALALSNNFSFDEHLARTAAPIMQRLRQRLGWPSDLAVFQHDKMVIADTNREPGMLSANRTVGSRVPIMASATGRAYLAYVSQEERKDILHRLKHSSDSYESLARDSAEVERIITETRQRGYALSDKEFLPTNRGAAVPVMVDGKVRCVINLIAIASIVSLQTVIEKYIPMLLEAKDELEEELASN